MKPDENKMWDQLSPEVQEKLGNIFDTYTLRDALAEIYLHGFDQGAEDAFNNIDYIS
jgi:hypothetical protein